MLGRKQVSPLQGKVAIITGASGGIGSATARLFAERGARLVLGDINVDAARQVEQEIRNAGGSAAAVGLDLADADSVRALVDTALAHFGRVDVLDNNAADLSPERGPRDRDIESMDLDVWDWAFRVNVRGTMLCCKHVLPHMVRQGGGSIINTASNLALQGNVIQAAYSASKAAVLQMTRSIAASHGKAGIRCNAVLPGLTLSPAAVNNLPAELRDIVESETLTPYLGEPMDIAYAVAFLASDEARYVTGLNLVADGGTSAHVPGFARLRAMIGQA